MDWFDVHKENDHLFVIRERLDFIEPRYRTKYTNMYVILGKKLAALIDTGSGLYPLRPLVESIIEDRELLVFNTHNHFDHIGGNGEFEEIHIHKLDYKGISKPFDVSFLKDSLKGDEYEKKGFRLPMANRVNPLVGGESFDLGGLTLNVIHALGHTPGSIVLYTSEGEIFTGDTVHFGAFYYPEGVYIEDYTEMLQEVFDEVEGFMEKGRLYPGHEEYGLALEVIQELIFELQVLNPDVSDLKLDEFLDAYVIPKSNFTMIIPKSII